jgi:predicted SnoaL-like aldol condensation-catalyzing enzyme
MDNEALVRRAIDAIWNRGELVVADELFGPDYVNHDGLIPDLVHGPEAIKISAALYRVAFPHFYITVEELSSEGETVLIHWTAWRDRTVADETPMTGITRSRLSGGKIVESWTQWDRTQELREFGSIQAD